MTSYACPECGVRLHGPGSCPEHRLRFVFDWGDYLCEGPAGRLSIGPTPTLYDYDMGGCACRSCAPHDQIPGEPDWAPLHHLCTKNRKKENTS